ncbi:unnamed protein product [Lota lota]
MHGIWLQVSALLGALVLSEVSGVEIYTPEQVEAVNGSDVRLKCTFSSTHPVSLSTVTVSWNFRPLDQASREESVFHYQEEPYPPTSGRFKDRVVWSGDISNRDASITLQGVPPTFNGTYTCQVRNAPDVHGVNGEIVLKVMDKVSLSEMALLAAIVGGACAVILILVVGYVLVKRRRQADRDLEMPEMGKDSTVCAQSLSHCSSCPGTARRETGCHSGGLTEYQGVMEVETRRMLCSPPAVVLMLSLMLGGWSVQGLEMLVGKIPFLVAVNGSTVLLPCSYLSCIGIRNLYFNWQFNDNGTMLKLCDSVIRAEGVEPHVSVYRERVEFVGSSKTSNVSILLWNITFEDAGEYTCFGRNPKEKGRNHSAIFTLTVVDELRVVDNTLTIIIASAVGGGIALLMGFMLLKNFTIFVLAKIEEKNKECLVSSSGIDNTENGLSGSKAESKPTPKKK